MQEVQVHFSSPSGGCTLTGSLEKVNWDEEHSHCVLWCALQCLQMVWILSWTGSALRAILWRQSGPDNFTM